MKILKKLVTMALSVLAVPVTLYALWAICKAYEFIMKCFGVNITYQSIMDAPTLGIPIVVALGGVVIALAIGIRAIGKRLAKF